MIMLENVEECGRSERAGEEVSEAMFGERFENESEKIPLKKPSNN